MININPCSADDSESKSVHKMDIIVNTKKLKDAKYEEPSVADNSNIKLIKAPGCFKLLKCVKMLFNNLYAKYEHVCVENLKGNYLL